MNISNKDVKHLIPPIMKPTLFTLLFILTPTFLYPQKYVADSFESEFGYKNGSSISVGKLSKEKRLKGTIGTTQIIAEIDNSIKEIDNLAPFVIEEAVKMWREQLLFIHDSAKIVISFKAEDLGNDIAYRGTTTHILHEDDGLFYPVALSQAIKGREQESKEDITITLNSNSDYWYLDGQGGSIQSHQYDFKTAILRALTQVFGFKASIASTRPEIKRNTFPNPFDIKIQNTSGLFFKDLKDTDRQIQGNFIQGNNVYFDNPNSGLKLYAPTSYKRGLSLDYFDSQDELMSYNFSPGSQNWVIDNKVIQVMNVIGWPVKETDFKINASMGETGIGNAYDSYTFTGSAITGNITNHHWEYRIKKKDGTIELIKTSNSSSFSIQPLPSIKEEYDTSSDGDILGEIALEGNVNGFRYKTTFNLYLECLPTDIKHDIKIIPIDDWHFVAEVTLVANGSTRLGMTVTDWEENITQSINRDVENYVKIKTFDLTYNSPIIFELRATNKYGMKTKRYTLPPVSPVTQSIQSPNTEISRYTLFDMSGNILLETIDKSRIYTHKLNKGFYFIKGLDKNGRIISMKKIIINN